MMNEPLKVIMAKNLYTISPDEKLSNVLELFKTKRIHHLPVVEDNKLIGLITTGDLLWLNKSFDEYDKILVKDVMIKKLATLEEDDKVGSAAELFLLNRFHAVPVVDGEKNLLGIVTAFDILKYEFKKEYPSQMID